MLLLLSYPSLPHLIFFPSFCRGARREDPVPLLFVSHLLQTSSHPLYIHIFLIYHNLMPGHDRSKLAEVLQCDICYLPNFGPYSLECGHTFCVSCLLQTLTSTRGYRGRCPTCRHNSDPASRLNGDLNKSRTTSLRARSGSFHPLSRRNLLITTKR
jgi:hypothetical protein